jgi:hypothetical protein
VVVVLFSSCVCGTSCSCNGICGSKSCTLSITSNGTGPRSQRRTPSSPLLKSTISQSKPLRNSRRGTFLFKMNRLAVMAYISARYAKPMGIQCGNPSREMINTKCMGANMCAFSTHRTFRHNVVLDIGQPHLYSPVIRWYMKRELELVANLFCIFDLNPIVVWFQITKKPLVCKVKSGCRTT